MHSYILSTLVVSSLLISCNAAYVDTINTCSIKDVSCLQSFFSNLFTKWTTTGFPEYDLNPVNSIKAIEKDTLSLTNELKIILDKGIVTGLKNCVVKGYSIDLEKGIMSHDFYCDLLDIDVDVTLSGSDVLLQGFFGNKPLDNSHGSGRITIEKIGLHFRLGWKLIKGDDGKTYFTLLHNEIEHKYDVENIKIAFDKFIIADQNLGPLFTEVVNSNTKLFLNSFGSAIVDKILEYIAVGLEKIYSRVPTQSFITEDLSSYV